MDTDMGINMGTEPKRQEPEIMPPVPEVEPRRTVPNVRTGVRARVDQKESRVRPSAKIQKDI